MNDYALNMQYFERWMRLQFNEFNQEEKAK